MDTQQIFLMRRAFPIKYISPHGQQDISGTSEMFVTKPITEGCVSREASLKPQLHFLRRPLVSRIRRGNMKLM